MRRLRLLCIIVLVLGLSLNRTIAEDVAQDDVAEAGNDDNSEGGDAAVEGDDQIQQAEQVEDNEDIDDNIQEAADEVEEIADDVETQDDDNVQINQGDDEVQANDNTQNQSANNNSAEDGTNYQSQIQVCSDAVIQVQDIVLYCDSPGTYYYGSGKYRNSQTCRPGDKARVEINFYIANHDMIQQAGNYALVDVYVQGGTYVNSATIYDNADLCSLSSLKKKSGNVCPYNGYYQIKSQFYWASSDTDEVFEPIVTIGFKSNVQKQVYDFGGANTNLCRGSTFLTWSDGVKVSYANALGNFMKSFGLLLLTIMLMGMLVFFLSKRPRSFREKKAQFPLKEGFLAKLSKENFLRRPSQAHRDLSIHVDEEFDFRKIQTAGNRDLVDF